MICKNNAFPQTEERTQTKFSSLRVLLGLKRNPTLTVKLQEVNSKINLFLCIGLSKFPSQFYLLLLTFHCLK